MADSKEKAKDAPQGGFKQLLIPLIAVTLVGGGGGGFLGYSLLGANGPAKTDAAGTDARGEGAKGEGAKGEAAKGEGDTPGKETSGASRGKREVKGEVKGGKDGEHGKADGHGEAGGHGGSAEHGAVGGKEAEQKPPEPPLLKVKELPPVVANIGGKERNIVRIQSAIVYDAHKLEQVDTLLPVLMSDITAFVETLDLSLIEGPDGLRRLQEELNERAVTRSEGRVHEFIIEALVVQ